jgi:L-ascorbate metabolism protein UlaG (beta-lactamase superfamily)
VNPCALGLALAVPPLGALAAHTGWLGSPRPWQDATGWATLRKRPEPRDTFELGGGELRLDWLGHSGFLLEWRRTRLLVDPNLSPRCTVARRVLEPAVAPAALVGIDAALVSHGHRDHLDLPTLLALPDLGTVVVPAGSERYAAGVRRRGVRVAGLAPGGAMRFGELEVVATEAAHNGGRNHPWASRHTALGYVVRAGGDAVFFAGDTAARADFAGLRSAFRPCLAVLPIGAWLPRWPLRHYHLSPEDAVAAAVALGLETVVPCHFGTFALALDHPAAALPRFAGAAAAAGVSWAMPKLLTEARR